jgi:hypothetical protein
LFNEHGRFGSLAPGHFAEFAGVREHPMTCEIDRLPDLKPAGWSPRGSRL